MDYAQGTTGYHVWLLEDHKVVVRKDVAFNEETLFKDQNMKTNDLDKDINPKIKKKITFSSNLEEL